MISIPNVNGGKKRKENERQKELSLHFLVSAFAEAEMTNWKTREYRKWYIEIGKWKREPETKLWKRANGKRKTEARE